MLPWSIKLVFGLLSDNFLINGYKRKNYLIINGFLGFLSLMVLVPDLLNTVVLITILLFFVMCAASSTDVLTDCLMVVE